MLDFIGNILVPILAVIVTVTLFRLKLYADARKKLDDELMDFEHEIFQPENGQSRIKLFHKRYPEIRKAASEYERWILNPRKKKRFKAAFEDFRGNKAKENDILKLKGTHHEKDIDALLTSMELTRLAPASSDFHEYTRRISQLRRFTGSRPNRA